MIINNTYNTMLNATLRRIQGKVELNGSTSTYYSTGKLKSFKVERVGQQSKILGFGICQKLTVKLIDTGSTISASKGMSLAPYYGVNDSYIAPHPTFYIEEVNRDENTGELTLVGYDILAAAAGFTVADLGITTPYTIREFTTACATKLGLTASIPSLEVFNTIYTGANFEGTETLRAALDAIAAATQTIYYIDNYNRLVFKRLKNTSDASSLIISKDKYFSLDTKPVVKYTGVTHVTELGDNVSTGTDSMMLYIRNNPFWELREDIATLVENAYTAIKDINLHPFSCDWRGNFLLEIGDKIQITTKDGTNLDTFVLDDTIEYDGALSQHTQWEYKKEDATASNPTSLGDILNKTYARVDKANKHIELVASEVGQYSSRIAELEITTDDITASVESVQKEVDSVTGEVDKNTTSISELQVKADSITASVETNEQEIDKITGDVSANTTSIAALNINTQSISASVESVQKQVQTDKENNDDAIETLTKKVDTKMSAEDVTLAITTELENGVDKVTTSTGFTFNEQGLNISKTDSVLSTQISEDGMAVSRSGTEVLLADNTGVKAENLHATTYLIIGNNSRLEDYDSNRTGCFWIGG